VLAATQTFIGQLMADEVCTGGIIVNAFSQVCIPVHLVGLFRVKGGCVLKWFPSVWCVCLGGGGVSSAVSVVTQPPMWQLQG
jgi:hypothetical protein